MEDPDKSCYATWMHPLGGDGAFTSVYRCPLTGELRKLYFADSLRLVLSSLLFVSRSDRFKLLYS